MPAPFDGYVEKPARARCTSLDQETARRPKNVVTVAVANKNGGASSGDPRASAQQRRPLSAQAQ
jgi:hypothetical protein